MAPIDIQKLNKNAGRATYGVPGSIDWRPMVINWFGTMVIAGLCAPLLVWFTIYYIRTRRAKFKRKSNAARSPPLTMDSGDAHGMVQLASNPVGNGDSTRKIPKSVHFRRYLGWWTSSSTSRERRYPRDPRARSDRSQPYKKRDHFVRYFGWWTCSEETARHENSSRTQRSDSVELPAIEISATSPESCDEIEDLHPHPLASALQERESRHQEIVDIPTIDSANNMQARSNQEPDNNTKPASTDLIARRLRACTTGADVRQYDDFNEGEVRTGRQSKFALTEGLSSDETSGHMTIRKRTVGVAEACDWANLHRELRKSVHSQLLLPDQLADEGPDERIPEIITTLREIPQIPEELPTGENIPEHLHLYRNLRKVYSSPNFRSAFEQLYTGFDTSRRYTMSLPIAPRPKLIPSMAISEIQDVEAEVGEDSGCAPNSSYISILPSQPSNFAVRAEVYGNSSLTFSFDAMRRSTLDVVTYEMEPDRQTLDDYELEPSVDADMSIRDSSGTTFASAEYDVVSRRDTFPQTTDNSIAVGCTYLSIGGLDKSFTPSLTATPHLETGCSSSATDVPIDKVSRICDEQPEHIIDRFATLNKPKRRYSFPSIDKKLDTRSEMDRKFTFRFADDAEKATEPATRARSHTLPYHVNINKFSAVIISRNDCLVIAKKRGPKPTKSNQKRKMKSRKLTPFVDCLPAPPPVHAFRQGLPKDWQTLNCPSEIASFHSENEPPLSSCDEASPQQNEMTASDCDNISCCSGHGHVREASESNDPQGCIDMDELTANATSVICPPGIPVPEERSTAILATPSMQAARPSISSMPENKGIMRQTLVPISKKGPIVYSTLTETTQPQYEASPIKRAFTHQSWAEKAKRRESMRRAGRLMENMNAFVQVPGDV